MHKQGRQYHHACTVDGTGTLFCVVVLTMCHMSPQVNRPEKRQVALRPRSKRPMQQTKTPSSLAGSRNTPLGCQAFVISTSCPPPPAPSRQNLTHSGAPHHERPARPRDPQSNTVRARGRGTVPSRNHPCPPARPSTYLQVLGEVEGDQVAEVQRVRRRPSPRVEVELLPCLVEIQNLHQNQNQNQNQTRHRRGNNGKVR